MSVNCFHCGQKIEEEKIKFDEHEFCCQGCKVVYEILNINDLKGFYEINKNPGIKPDSKENHQFEFLNAPEVFDKVVDFCDDGVTLVTFHIPVIHCTSCVWLLESLHTINEHIIYSNVNFSQKNVQISFRNEKLSLSELAIFITSLGYKPSISLETLNKKKQNIDRSLLYRLVVAGFCAGNIMLLAFPEYLDYFFQDGGVWLEQNRVFFRWIMLVLAMPVFFYSATVYFASAWQGLKNKYINIDFPISLGLFVIFLRSVYEIVFDVGSGYFDTLGSLVFFMLIGRWFQQRTFKSMAFDRDYKSFYPIAIAKIEGDIEQPILLSELKKGDRILIRNEEIIPADVILMKGEAMIDNSFVTGESRLISKKVGDKIFAGGKQSGKVIELEVVSDVNQSYLTQLWNNEAFNKEESQLNALTNSISKYFTLVILSISFLAAVFWYFKDSSQIMQVVTAVLIISCPCGLALSSPFILGNMMRIFGARKFYIKSTSTIENMAKVKNVVFDKTGTITENDATKISYQGKELLEEQKIMLKAVLRNSNHPLSRILYKTIKEKTQLVADDFGELPGKGLWGKINGHDIKIGSKKLVGIESEEEVNQTEVNISIDGIYYGKYVYQNQYREGFKELIQELDAYKLSVLSGDNDAEKEVLASIFPEQESLNFNQTPSDKLEYIRKLQQKGGKVMMLGDGLNDAGALKQSDVGVSVSDDMNSFSPSCDAILDARNFRMIGSFLKLSTKSMTLVKIAFLISFLYNIIGVSFAVAGYMTPVVAAILMPISSISVVLFATFSTRIVAYFHEHCLE